MLFSATASHACLAKGALLFGVCCSVQFAINVLQKPLTVASCQAGAGCTVKKAMPLTLPNLRPGHVTSPEPSD